MKLDIAMKFAPRYLCLMVLWLSSFASTQVLDNVFEFPEEKYYVERIYNVPQSSTCPPANKNKLRRMFEEMAEVGNLMSVMLNYAPEKWAFDSLTIFCAFFQGSPQDDHARPGMDLMKSWAQIISQILYHPVKLPQKVRLYCGSQFLKFMKPGDLVPSGLRERPDQTVLEYFGREVLANFWIFFVPDQGPEIEHNGERHPQGAWLKLRRADYPSHLVRVEPFQRNAAGNPDYCADRNRQNPNAWSLVGEDSGQAGARPQSILILCPSFFTRPLPSGRQEDSLDLGAQPVGTRLSSMEPRWSVFFHELFHLFIEEAMIDYPYYEADMARVISREREGEANALRHRDCWRNTGRPAHGPDQCGNLAVWGTTYPRGRPNEGTPFLQRESIRNPESYTWFAIALYLWQHGPESQSWATGKIEAPLPAQALEQPNPRDKRPAHDSPEGQPNPSRPRYQHPGPGSGQGPARLKRDFVLESNSTEVMSAIVAGGLAAAELWRGRIE